MWFSIDAARRTQNALEAAFLVTCIFLLLCGMIFNVSPRFGGSSAEIILALTILVALLLFASIGSFLAMLVFEVYRALRLAPLVDAALRKEIAVSRQMWESRRYRRRASVQVRCCARRGAAGGWGRQRDCNGPAFHAARAGGGRRAAAREAGRARAPGVPVARQGRLQRRR